MKKLFAILLPIVLLVGAVVGYIEITSVGTLGYVSVDINPSVQFVTDEDGEVIGVSASNDDGELILVGEVENLLGLSVEEATERIVTLAIEFGYLNPDALETDPNAVTITTMLQNQNEQEEDELRQRVKTRVQNFFKNNGIFGRVITDADLTGAVAEAEALGVSVGRYKLIKSVQAVYPELTDQEALELEVKELMQMLREMATEQKAQERVQKRIDLVEHFNQKVQELQAEIAIVQTELTTKQNELTTLEATDTTLFDAAQLEAHNSALQDLGDEVQNLLDELAELEADLLGLQNALSQHTERLEQLFMERLQMQKQERREQAEERYNAWLEQKQERAQAIADRWEQFKNSFTEEDLEDILDNLQNQFGLGQDQ
jgi:hypothetical protein